MPSWIGPWEIAIVVVIALLIFGPRKLPELGSSFGKSIRGFKKGLKEGQDEINETVAEVKEATRMDEPVVKTATAEASSATTTAEAPAAAASAEAKAKPAAEATATAAAAEATGSAADSDTKPRCWGTYEQDDESCRQCTISEDCAKAGAEAPTAV